MAQIAAILALVACTSQSKVADDLVRIDPCTTEYLAALTAGRGLEDTAGCIWSQLSDLRRSDRIQSEIIMMHPTGGEPVGYKVTKASDGRVVGTITDGMLLRSASKISLSSSARLLGEADLLVRVKTTAIMQAVTLEGVAAEVDAVIPFIESSDMMLPQGTPRTKAIWTASNGNARWGVLGDELDVSGMVAADIVSTVGALSVELVDEHGETIQISSMKRHPLQSVLDVIEDMQRRGNVQLEAGDLISLGNFGRPRYPNPGNAYTAIYHGLTDPAPRVVVTYE